MNKRRKLDMRRIPDAVYIIRFINSIRINNSSGCWEWVGSKNPQGYGSFSVRRTQISSHIYAMVLTDRHISGLYVDHTCMNKACCNPDHLRMVSPRTNVVENNSSPAFINANKTHCKYNHPFNKQNTGVYNNKGKTQRVCLACKRERRSNSLKNYGYKN